MYKRINEPSSKSIYGNIKPEFHAWVTYTAYMSQFILYVLPNTPLQVPHMLNRAPIYNVNMLNWLIIPMHLYNYL